MTRNERIIRKIAQKCNRISIASIILSILAITWIVVEVYCNEPISTLPTVLAWVGIASAVTATYIGKTIEDVK